MSKKPFIAQTSMVPVLACIAALLFSANFYQFMQKNFKKWWGWDFQCPNEQVDCQRFERHTFHEHRKHRKHRHYRKHRKHRQHQRDVQERSAIILNFEGEHLGDVHRKLEEAREKLQRNLDKAVREFEQLHERMEWDSNAEANLERLEHEIEVKMQSLQRVQEALEKRMILREHDMDFEFDVDVNRDKHVEIRVRKR